MTDDATPQDGMPIRFEVSVAKLPQNGMPVRFEPDADERAALAVHLSISAVPSFAADLLVRRWKRDGVEVTGRMTGELVQESVVSLTPVHQRIDEPVKAIFVPENSKLARIQPDGDGELHLSAEGDDIPETFRGDRIDLGAYLCEIVALALEPYPRSDDEEFGDFDTDPDPDGGKVSPFAALARIKPSPSS